MSRVELAAYLAAAQLTAIAIATHSPWPIVGLLGLLLVGPGPKTRHPHRSETETSDA